MHLNVISISSRQRDGKMRTKGLLFLKATIGPQNIYSRNGPKPVYLPDVKDSMDYTLQKAPSILVSCFNEVPELTDESLELDVLPGVTSDQFDSSPFSALRLAND